MHVAVKVITYYNFTGQEGSAFVLPGEKYRNKKALP
jgi:hypothetical protein